MKKTFICLIAAVMLLIPLALPAFALTEDNYAFISPFYEGLKINDPDIGSSTNRLRKTWTPSRGLHMDTVIVKQADDTLVLKIVAPQWFKRDTKVDDMADFTVSYKKDVCSGFLGMVSSYGGEFQDPKMEGSKTQNDYFFTEFEAVSSDNSCTYPMISGFGYTYLMNSNSKIRVFVRTIVLSENGISHPDVIYYDYDTGIDLTQDYHAIDFYVDPNGNAAAFAIDEKVFAALDFDTLETVKTSILEGSFEGQYYRTAKIYNAAGNVVKSTDSALIGTSQGIAIVATGEGTTCLVDYMATSKLYRYPTVGEVETNDEVTTAEVTTAEVTTAEVTTAVENTEAETKSAEVTTSKTEDSGSAKSGGCKSAFAGTYAIIAVSALAFAVAKKKKKD